MFVLDEVYKSFAGQPVLRGIDLATPAGRTTILIGPSGCGKSTLLRLLLGLIYPDRGRVTLDGQPLDPKNIRGLRHQIGYVTQDGGLFPHLTARQNITLMAGRLGWEVSRVRARLDELVRLTHFPVEGLERYPSELSGGQRQRVALMRALMLDPRVLLLDEPLAALDPMVRFDLQEDLRRVFTSLRKTTVLVTHDLAEAAFFGDLILLMRDGSIVQQGTVRDLVERPAEPFVTRFLQAQRAPMHALEATRA